MIESRSRTARIAATLVVAIAFGFGATGAWAFSEEFELALARGEYLYQQDDTAQAEPYFDLCLALDPGHGRANQFKALCALADERYDEAAKHLTIALEAEPDNPEVAVDLARVYASSGDSDKAWDLIVNLPDEVRSRPLVRYFEGVVQVDRKQYVAAIPPLEDVARVDHPQAIRASFYLGFALEKLRRYDEAREQYNRVLAYSDDARLVAEANRRVRRMDKRVQQVEKWWSVRGGVGAFYDDNVPLEPEEFDITDEKGFQIRTYADAGFKVFRHEAGYVGVGGGLRYHGLIAGDSDLRDYDLLRATGRVFTRWRLFRARVAGYAGLRASYDHTWLDFDDYLDRITVQPSFDLYEAQWTATRVSYLFTYRDFPDFSKRFGLAHEPRLAQFFFLPEVDGYAQISAAATVRYADSFLYEYFAVSGFASLDLRVVWLLYVDAGAEYEMRNYADHPLERLDRQINLSGALYVKALPWMNVRGEYRYAVNDSKSRYAWTRNVIGVSVEFRY